ncbi:MAG: glycosyltransferase [Longimicrobiales bacterium]
MSQTERPTALIFRRRLLPWSETFIAEQGGALRRYRPVFVGYDREPGGAAYLEGRTVVLSSEHATVPAMAKALLKAARALTPRWRAALASYQPRLLHAHFGTNAVDAIGIARTFDIPLVVTYHGSDIAIERSRLALRRRARVFRAAERIIAVSEFIAAKLLDAGCPPVKLTVHHIGVDTERFAPAAAPREPATILFVGRLVPKKGLAHLLRAMRLVRDRVPAATLLVVGDGPLRSELEALAARVEPGAHFLGVQEPARVRALMRRATVLCAPSVVTRQGDAEGLPMTIVEAQASGLPVVAFPSGGSAEGIVHGETGFVAPPRDEAALADYLVQVLADPVTRERFATTARARALAEFDLTEQTRRLERIYDEARGL